LKSTITKHDYFDVVTSARDDYVREEGIEDDIWLLNPNWKVKPSIAFIDGLGPVVLTCRDHENGSRLKMIHTCRQPNHILPAKLSDQLCHAVIQSRTIKPVKSSKFSTSFQLHEQRGNMNGIDTCSITNFRKFDFCSLLHGQAEARCITNRPDIYALLSQFVREQEMSSYAANEKRAEARILVDGIDFTPCYNGSTYVPLPIAMSFHKELLEENERAIIDDAEEDVPRDNIRCFRKSWPRHIYPLQKVNTYGAAFPQIPKFGASYSPDLDHFDTIMIWRLSAILTRIDALWKIITEVELRRSNWHGWLLIWLSKMCFPELTRRQDRKDPFSFQQVKSVQNIVQRLNLDNTFEHIFAGIESVLCIDHSIFDGELDEVVDVEQHQIIIIDEYEDQEPDLQLSYEFGDVEYELRVILNITWLRTRRGIPTGKWDGNIYSRHGDTFTSWWVQRRDDYLSQHFVGTPIHEPNQCYTFVYVKAQKIDVRSLGLDFLTYIGGQKHLLCHEHRMPLITSLAKHLKCNCGRHEYYSCSHAACKCCICKRCADTHDIDNVTYVEIIRREEEAENNENEDRGNGNDSDDDIENDSLDEPYDENEIFNSDDEVDIEDPEYRRQFNGRKNDVLDREDFDEFVTSGDIHNQDYDEEAFDDGIIPTTHAGEFSVEVNDESPKKGVYVSGHVLLNGCGSCLCRKKNEIKTNKNGRFLLEQICSICLGESVPLLYPETMLFPSIHWMMADSFGSIPGAIPAALLNSHIGKFGFASIPQHLRQRLKSSSAATSTDPRYIAFSYDTLTNLSANHSDTRIILNRGLTAESDDSGGLGLRGGNQDALLESIDSKQMVKNLCASQSKHPMDFFLTFTCNPKEALRNCSCEELD